jgi:putative flavoprotein involved in K+ transport
VTAGQQHRPGDLGPAGEPEHHDVLVVGAGQAGLGVAYWLSRTTDLRVQVLDASPGIGRSWASRWDSLELFTPRRFSGLPGLRFPSGAGNYPSKNEMAAYLARYAARFDLPVVAGRAVRSVRRTTSGFDVMTDDGLMTAGQVVVATGPYDRPYVPAAASDLTGSVHQLHSSQYCRPADIPGGSVHVVGGGNSAAQLACELARTHDVTVVSSRPPWFLPKSIAGISLYWWLYATRLLNADADAPVSRQVRRRGDPIIGKELRRRVRDGEIRLLPQRVTGAAGDRLQLGDGSGLTVEAVLWCTGFQPDYGWIDIPGATDAEGRPVQLGGASPVPGLHWIGLPWQTRMNSGIIDGIDRDARATADRVAHVHGGSDAEDWTEAVPRHTI